VGASWEAINRMDGALEYGNLNEALAAMTGALNK
jgi:hypothetical protein